MPTYRIRVVAAGGSAVQELTLAADSAEMALSQAGAQGAVVLGVAELKNAGAAGAWNAVDLAWWCRELRTLVGAGMTVVEALETLETGEGQASVEQDRRRRLQGLLLDRLRRGDSLSQAMATVGAFPPILRASVQAAERTSNLTHALDEFLRYDAVREALRRRVSSAAVYPALVCLVGVVISAFLLVVVMPRFNAMLSSNGTSGEGLSGGLLRLSAALTGHPYISLAVVIMGAAFAVYAWRQGALGRVAMRTLQALPPCARAMRDFELAKLFQSMALLVRGGYALDEAVGVCRRAAESAWLEVGLGRVQDWLRQGHAVAEALRQAGLSDAVTTRLLAVGQRSGEFANVLELVAGRHEQAFGIFMDRLMRLVEPILLLLVASLVGGIVVLMYLPIFDIASGLPG